MAIFLATGPIDPAANEIRGYQRGTQEEAEATAAANSRPNQPWSVFELVECATLTAQAPRLNRVREPQPAILAGENNADPTAATDPTRG